MSESSSVIGLYLTQPFMANCMKCLLQMAFQRTWIKINVRTFWSSTVEMAAHRLLDFWLCKRKQTPYFRFPKLKIMSAIKITIHRSDFTLMEQPRCKNVLSNGGCRESNISPSPRNFPQQTQCFQIFSSPYIQIFAKKANNLHFIAMKIQRDNSAI